MEKLADVYSCLFAQITHQSDETAPPCHGNTQQYPKLLLQKVNKLISGWLPKLLSMNFWLILQQEDSPSVLLQLSVYRKLFSLSITSNTGCNQCVQEDSSHNHLTSEMVVTAHTVESYRLGLCRGLTTEAESVINIVVRYKQTLEFHSVFCFARERGGGSGSNLHDIVYTPLLALYVLVHVLMCMCYFDISPVRLVIWCLMTSSSVLLPVRHLHHSSCTSSAQILRYMYDLDIHVQCSTA